MLNIPTDSHGPLSSVWICTLQTIILDTRRSLFKVATLLLVLVAVVVVVVVVIVGGGGAGGGRDGGCGGGE